MVSVKVRPGTPICFVSCEIITIGLEPVYREELKVVHVHSWFFTIQRHAADTVRVEPVAQTCIRRPAPRPGSIESAVPVGLVIITVCPAPMEQAYHVLVRVKDGTAGRTIFSSSEVPVRHAQVCGVTRA